MTKQKECQGDNVPNHLSLIGQDRAKTLYYPV